MYVLLFSQVCVVWRNKLHFVSKLRVYSSTFPHMIDKFIDAVVMSAINEIKELSTIFFIIYIKLLLLFIDHENRENLTKKTGIHQWMLKTNIHLFCISESFYQTKLQILKLFLINLLCRSDHASSLWTNQRVPLNSFMAKFCTLAL